MGVALALFAVSNPVAGSPKFSGWSTPVNLGPGINSVLRENGPAISKDGLSLYFGSFRDGGFGGSHIWGAPRASVDHSLGPPVNLRPTIKTASPQAGPRVFPRGSLVFFQPGGRPCDGVDQSDNRPASIYSLRWTRVVLLLGPGGRSRAD